MTIYDSVKKAQLEARKERNTRDLSILTTLLGELSLKATMLEGEKVVTDDGALGVLKKYVKNLDEMLTFGQTIEVLHEKDLVSKFLPRQFTEEELRRIISGLAGAGEGLPSIMKHLKENYAGLYDGRLASRLAAEYVEDR